MVRMLFSCSWTVRDGTLLDDVCLTLECALLNDVYVGKDKPGTLLNDVYVLISEYTLLDDVYVLTLYCALLNDV